MKSVSVSSSTEDVEAIVRRVLLDELAKQKQRSSGETRYELLNIEDFELPDDLGSMFHCGNFAERNQR